jgi:hypothetical protein
MPNTNKKYIMPTPGGAYYLAQDGSVNWKKEVLRNLFSLHKSPELNSDSLVSLFNTSNKENLYYKLEECEKLKIIQVIEHESIAPTGNFEKILNSLLGNFSNKNNVLLSDSQGFCISNHGFPNEMIEEISVLSADIAIMHKRRAVNINKKLGLHSQAWSIVDASGNSSLGFWPLNIGKEVFVLTIEGVPFFNQTAFTSLVWILNLRFGKDKDEL